MFQPDVSQMTEAIPANSLPGIPLDCLLELFNVTDILMDSDNITIDKFGEFTPQDPRITLRFNAAPRVTLISAMRTLRQMPCVAPQGGTFRVQQYGGPPGAAPDRSHGLPQLPTPPRVMALHGHSRKTFF